MIKKWLRLSYLGGDPWVLPIRRAIHNAEETGKVIKQSGKLGQLPFHISIRLDMLPVLIERLNQECLSLYDAIKGHGLEHEYKVDQEGYAFKIDNELKFRLLIDIDSLLFEINSCSELIKEFVRLAYDYVGTKIDETKVGKKVQEIIEDEGEDTSWFVELNKTRNFFMHEGTPYIAVDISNEKDDKFDLLIMKENLREFINKEKFVTLSEINNIVYGFIKAKSIIQKHIIELYAHL